MGLFFKFRLPIWISLSILISLVTYIYFLKSNLEDTRDKVLELTEEVTLYKSNQVKLLTSIESQNTAIQDLNALNEKIRIEYNKRLEESKQIDIKTEVEVQKILVTKVDKSCEGSMKWLLEQSLLQSSW